MDIVSRLKQFLDANRISVTQFADECSIPRPSASQLLNGRNKKVSDEVISKIHATYPSLSMLWLLFGEGDMGPVANIETSEPQISPEETFDEPQQHDTQVHALELSFTDDIPGEELNKIAGDTPAEKPLGVSDEEQAPYGYARKPRRHESRQASYGMPESRGRRVMSIVVYYDDNSFESFIPDPDHANPFAR